MADICTDNRFELIDKYKKELIEGTNIETSQDEMAVLDSLLFRFWQMGWLDRLEQPERKKGKWTKGSDMPLMKYRNGKPKKFWPYFQYCSNCGHKAFADSDWGEQLFDWCPYCGADMRG